MTLHAIESRIASLPRSKIQGARPVGVIKCAASDGSSDFTGEVEVGSPQRKKRDVTKALGTAGGSESHFVHDVH